MKLTGSLDAAVVWVRARRAKVLVRSGKYIMSNGGGVECAVRDWAAWEGKCGNLVLFEGVSVGDKGATYIPRSLTHRASRHATQPCFLPNLTQPCHLPRLTQPCHLPHLT